MNAIQPGPQGRMPLPMRGGLPKLLSALVMVVGLAACASGDGSSPATQPREPATSMASELPVPSLAAGDAAPPARSGSGQIPSRTIEQSGGFRLASVSSASCTAEAPVDWAMQASDRSDSADVVSPDGAMYAGYGIQAVNTSLYNLAYVYDPPLNDPNLYSNDPAAVALAYGQIVIAALGGTPDLGYAGALIQPTAGYLLMPLAGSTHRGVIFFRASGFPGDGVNYSYALPMYFAFTTADLWEREGPLVARVAASIRCSAQFQPPDDYPVVEAAAVGDGDTNGDEAGYNPQLGTEHVNDPTTGENYLVDPSTNWSETGPDGPGYYVQKGGNDYQMLEPGRVD